MVKRRKSTFSERLYQLRMVLEILEPSIWRTLLTPGTVKLSKLDHIILEAFGWSHSYLHDFWNESTQCAMAASVDDWTDVLPLLDLRQLIVRPELNDDLDHLVYLCPFGDGWIHIVTDQEQLDPT